MVRLLAACDLLPVFALFHAGKLSAIVSDDAEKSGRHTRPVCAICVFFVARLFFLNLHELVDVHFGISFSNFDRLSGSFVFGASLEARRPYVNGSLQVQRVVRNV